MNTKTTFKHAIIYKIIFPNNKIYIGRWTGNFNSLKKRYLIKEKNHIRPVNFAINKYRNEVEFETIEELFDCTNDALNERESFWIKKYNSLIGENGYNIVNSGKNYDTYINNPRYDEIINNIKVRFEKYGHPRTGTKHSVESRKIISNLAKERLKDKRNHPSFGKKRTSETKLKMSMSRKGKYLKEENAMWMKPIEKKYLIKFIKTNTGIRDAMKYFHVSQRIIQRSLLYNFGHASMLEVKKKLNIFIIPKDRLKTQILNGLTIRELCKKFKCSNNSINKLLKLYFNEYNLPIVRKKLRVQI